MMGGGVYALGFALIREKIWKNPKKKKKKKTKNERILRIDKV